MAENEAHVSIRRHVGAQSRWKDLGCVSRSSGGQNTPREAAKNLSDDKDSEGRREEDNKNSGRQSNKSTEDNGSGAEFGDQVAAENTSKDGADATGLREARLPRSSQLVSYWG